MGRIRHLWERFRRFYSHLEGTELRRFWLNTVLWAAVVVCALIIIDVAEPWTGAAARHAAQGRPFKTEDYVQVYIWWSSVGMSLVCALLALTSRWWFRWTCPDSPTPSERVQLSPGTLGWIALGLALLGALTLRMPYMGGGVLWDEQDNLRRNFHGYLEIRDNGVTKWRPAGYREAAFENERTNNPFLYSLSAKVSMDIWRLFSGVDRQRFNVVALRLPALLAGLGSIAAIWWLMQLFGFRHASVIALAFAAIHRFHMDYSVQARGYCFLLLLVPVSVVFAWLALRDGRWRHWIAYTACIFGCLYAFPGATYYAVPMTGLLLLHVAWKWWRNREPRSRAQVARLLTCSLFAGLLYLFLISPALAPMLEDFKSAEGFGRRALGADRYFLFWSNFTTGTRFPPHEIFTTVGERWDQLWRYIKADLMVNEPRILLISLLLVPGFALIGLIQFIRKAPYGWLWGTASVLAPVLALIHQRLTNFYIYWWYLIYFLPFLIVYVAIGLFDLGKAVARPLPQIARAPAAYILAAFFLVFFQRTTSPPGPARGIPITNPWRQGEDGEYVEFPRGRSRWVAYRDGRHFRYRDFYPEKE